MFDKRWISVLFVLVAIIAISLLTGYNVARASGREVMVTFSYGQQPQQFLDCYMRRGDLRRNITNGKLDDGDTCQETLYK